MPPARTRAIDSMSVSMPFSAAQPSYRDEHRLDGAVPGNIGPGGVTGQSSAYAASP